MLRVAAACGVDAVKFQKRTPENLFTKKLLDTSYDSPHSYGKTYGEHRAALDWFGLKEFKILKGFAAEFAIDFIVTPFTQPDAEFVRFLDVDAIKVASCDLNNKPLLQQIAKYEMPVILSTGGGTINDIHSALNWLWGIDVAILHCISSYPVGDNQLDLNNINTLRTMFPGYVVGFSSHHSGLLPHYLAHLLGARIFEVHFTLNRGWKGTDHGFSLEPDGLRRMCSDLKRIDTMLGEFERVAKQKEGFLHKFGKSWHSARGILPGEAITESMLCLLGPADGLAPAELNRIVGRAALEYIPEQTAITSQLIEKLVGA
jgi:N-acetylneuraminate synthase/sialic acid synthase